MHGGRSCPKDISLADNRVKFLFDFVRRVSIAPGILENLILCGALMISIVTEGNVMGSSEYCAGSTSLPHIEDFSEPEKLSGILIYSGASYYTTNEYTARPSK